MIFFKRLLLLSFLCSLTISIFAQTFNSKLFKKYKKEKRTFVFYTLDINEKKDDKKEAYNQALVKTLTNHWNIKAPYLLLNKSDAYDYASKNEDSSLLVEVSTEGFVGMQFATILRILAVEQRMNGLRMAAYIPLSKNLAEADLIYAINTLQFTYNDMEKYNSMFKISKPRRIDKNLLSKKTLLLPEEMMHKKLTKSVLSKLYPYPFKLVPEEEIEKTIINMEEDYLVLYDAQMPTKDGVNPVWVIYNPNDGTTANAVRGRLNTEEAVNLKYSPYEVEFTIKKKDIKNLLR